MNWNSRSIRNKEGEFFEFIEKHEIDVAVVTETWLQPNISIYHPNYSCVRLDRPSHVANRGGGVAIFVRNGIAFRQADGLNTSSIEAVEIVLNFESTVVRIIAAYFPGSSNRAILNNFKRDLRKLTDSPEPFFVVGDFNSKHRHWHCSKSNKAGEMLLQESENGNFFVHYPESYTRISPGGKYCSTLDLVLSNNYVNMTVPHTLQELCSDHYPVVFSINTDSPVVTQVRKYKNYDRADWNRFANSVNRRLDVTSSLLNNLDTTQKIDDSIHAFAAALKAAEVESVPVVNITSRITNFPIKLSC